MATFAVNCENTTNEIPMPSPFMAFRLSEKRKSVYALFWAISITLNNLQKSVN